MQRLEAPSSCPFRAVADRNYVAHNAAELSFRVGDTLLILDATPSTHGWWYAEHSGKQGYIPGGLVHPVLPEMDGGLNHHSKSAAVRGFVATECYSPKPKGLENFTASATPPTLAHHSLMGNSIDDDSSSEDILAELASLEAPPQTISSPTLPTRPLSDRSHNRRKDRIAIAMMNYNGGDRELSFRTGDQLTIVRKAESGWWLAQIHGKYGWVPSTFIREHHTAQSGASAPEIPPRSISALSNDRNASATLRTASASSSITHGHRIPPKASAAPSPPGELMRRASSERLARLKHARTLLSSSAGHKDAAAPQTLEDFALPSSPLTRARKGSFRTRIPTMRNEKDNADDDDDNDDVHDDDDDDDVHDDDVHDGDGDGPPSFDERGVPLLPGTLAAAMPLLSLPGGDGALPLVRGQRVFLTSLEGEQWRGYTAARGRGDGEWTPHGAVSPFWVALETDWRPPRVVNASLQASGTSARAYRASKRLSRSILADEGSSLPSESRPNHRIASSKSPRTGHHQEGHKGGHISFSTSTTTSSTTSSKPECDDGPEDASEASTAPRGGDGEAAKPMSSADGAGRHRHRRQQHRRRRTTHSAERERQGVSSTGKKAGVSFTHTSPTGDGGSGGRRRRRRRTGGSAGKAHGRQRGEAVASATPSSARARARAGEGARAQAEERGYHSAIKSSRTRRRERHAKSSRAGSGSGSGSGSGGGGGVVSPERKKGSGRSRRGIRGSSGGRSGRAGGGSGRAGGGSGRAGGGSGRARRAHVRRDSRHNHSRRSHRRTLSEDTLRASRSRVLNTQHCVDAGVAPTKALPYPEAPPYDRSTIRLSNGGAGGGGPASPPPLPAYDRGTVRSSSHGVLPIRTKKTRTSIVRDNAALSPSPVRSSPINPVASSPKATSSAKSPRTPSGASAKSSRSGSGKTPKFSPRSPPLSPRSPRSAFLRKRSSTSSPHGIHHHGGSSSKTRNAPMVVAEEKPPTNEAEQRISAAVDFWAGPESPGVARARSRTKPLRRLKNSGKAEKPLVEQHPHMLSGTGDTVSRFKDVQHRLAAGIGTCVATKSYVPKNPDELGFSKGDFILVIEKPEYSAQWWRGRIGDGEVGYFLVDHTRDTTEENWPLST